MKLPRLSLLAAILAATALASATMASAAEPLRVFIRAGVKTHGPEQHDHPRFLAEWTKLLNDRGARATGGMEWPTAGQLAQTDVVVMYCKDGGDFRAEQQSSLNAYLQRGGGIVVIHDAVCGSDAPWFKTIVGGAWQHGKAKWFEGDISLYYVDHEHPITKDASNFDFDDELYYELDFAPGARVLATTWTPDERAKKNGRAFPHIYNTAPQMWVYEKDNYRAFVSLPGHNWKTFELPNYRAILLRGIAWAGKRSNVDELCAKDELAALRYPPGGPSKAAESLTKLTIHPDFQMSLVATEPLINKPMNIDWDPAGRLWVAETPEYPNGRRGVRPDYAGREWKDHGGLDQTPGQQDRPARDRISWLEDTDRDGVADKKHVFHEGLELVTGLVFHRDGVIVTQAPDILWLRDTNQDGRADKVEKLYTGLGTNDTHAVINNPRWGFDGWIYATHGYSSSRDVTNGDGSKHFGAIGSGVVRFKPDGSAFEQFSSKGGNTWGLTVTADNEIIWTQPTSGDLVMHTILSEGQLSRGKFEKTPSFKVITRSGKAFPAMTWLQQAYRQIDWVGSFTAAAGTVIYDGGTWPAEYHGDYFTTEPTINILHHERFQPEGVSFAGFKLPGREETEFVTSKDLWFRPIEVRVGPDGAMYVVDFYNQAVIHNDTRGPDHNKVNAAVRPDRDHYFGRVWRLDHQAARKIAPPDLSRADASALAASLEHPNKTVRFNAHRLLVEKGAGADLLAKLANDASKPSFSRLHALWILHLQGKLTPAVLTSAISDKDASVSRNALRIMAASEQPGRPAEAAIIARLRDGDPRTRLAAILALGAGKPTAAGIAALLDVWPALDDPWLQSAAIAAGNIAAPDFLVAALTAPKQDALKPFMAQLAAKVRETPADAARLVIILAGHSGSDPAKQTILTALAEDAAARPAPEWNAALEEALSKLLSSEAGSAVLPLAAAWDKKGALAAPARTVGAKLLATLNDPAQPDSKRAAAIPTLLALKSAEAKTAVTTLLNSPSSAALRTRVVEALGEAGDADTGRLLAEAFPQLEPGLQSAALAQLLKRPEWTRALIAGLQDQSIPIAALGPIGLDRLRNYPDRKVAKDALAVIETIRGPQIAEKNKVIAQLLPHIETGGDATKGKALYTTACAVCHKFNNEGSTLAPDLTGMGAHPRAELLTHIVDPNREVDPTFAAWMVELKDGNAYVGIITRENAQSVTVRDQTAEREVKKSDIKTQAPMNRSLMPEGLDALGAEPLRDLLAYLESAGAGRFRIIDLSKAATADGRLGMFARKEALSDAIEFAKYGHVALGEVPFQIIDPAKSATGLNLIALRGGQGEAKNYPARVEVPVPKVRATALHFLGGIAGWGYPATREELPAAKVTIMYEGGAAEELELLNGREFADYNRSVEVPGSQLVPKLSKRGQARVFRKPLAIGGVIEKLVLESYKNQISPVFVALTAEAGDQNTPPPSYGVGEKSGTEARPPGSTTVPPDSREKANEIPNRPSAELATLQPPAAANGMRALLVGGGSAHDFAKWFGEADKATLRALQPAWLEYTQDANGTPPVLKNIDVLVWSANQPIASETCAALINFANAGKGLIPFHPGTWYAWNNFPQWNKEIVGGGTRGHDKFGEFEVEVVEADHPIMAGLPAKFKISDELYHFVPDPDGTPIKVLARATSPKTGKTFPQVWVTQHPKSRIVCITLGHDGKAHELPEFQRLLKNAVQWVAKP